jgi:hypothetical protein
LEGDEGLAGAGGEGQQNALPAVGDGFEGVLDGIVLVVARLPRPALVLEGDGGEAVAPCVFLGAEDDVPEEPLRVPFGDVGDLDLIDP